MTERRIGDIAIRPFDAQRDTEPVRAIISEIWGGGSCALMEKEFGIIGGRPWGEWTANAVLDYFKRDNARAFVAEKNGDVVGFCSYVVDPARKCGTVGYNGVAKGHQGTGIGSMMMDFVMDGFRAKGMEYAVVLVADNEAHLPALRNYEKHGFRRLTGYHELVRKLRPDVAAAHLPQISG
jgi:GNAT superfamily N-acetyltransferase